MAWYNDIEDLKKITHKDGALGSAFAGGGSAPDLETEAEMQALQDLIGDYAESTPEEYQDLGGYTSEIAPDSALAGIATDPRFSDAELKSLEMLEKMSDEGLNATDRAELARVEGGVNRNLQGQMGAIKQNMQSRGISGSGLDLMSQQNAAQGAAERQAYADLEIAGQGQRRRENATMNLGQLGSQLSQQDFDRQAKKAQAQDVINRFNTQNTNIANQSNAANSQNVSNQNVGSRNRHTDNVYDQRMKGAGMNYDANVDQYNVDATSYQHKEDQKREREDMILGGAMKAGTAMLAHGGKIPGETNGIDSYADDTIEVMVQPGEIVIPETVAQSPEASAEFVARENGQMMAGTEVGNPPNENPDDDIIGKFIDTVAALTKKRRV